MKLFHTENGKKTVYVQMADMMQLYQSNMPIPASIFEKVFTSGMIYADNLNWFKFIRFDKEHEVKFFREIEFILDYDQYKDLNDEQLDKEGRELTNRANKIAEKWNPMSVDEREQNCNLIEEHENIEYMLHFLAEIIAIKHGKSSMPFPDFVKLPTKPKKKGFFQGLFQRKKM